MKYDDDYGSSDFCSCTGPEIVNDISNGCRQALLTEYYKATMKMLEAGTEDRISFALINPKESGVNVYIRRIYAMNHSVLPLSLITYFAGKVGGNIEIAEWIRNTNTYHFREESRINVYFGRNLLLKGCRADARSSVPAYQTAITDINGEILIAPGCSYVAELTSLILGESFAAAVSAEWWEEPVR